MTFNQPSKSVGTHSRDSSSMELLAIFVVLILLIIVVVPTYFQYLDKAKLTLASNTVNSVGKALDLFKQQHKSYPAKINFSTGLDPSGAIVFTPELLEQIHADFSSIETYVTSGKSYILLVHAADKKRTLITLKPNKTTIRK